jgi:hypothetical protein
MLRLTGLPHAGRWPHATVSASGGEIDIVFSGAEGEQTINIPESVLGEVEDLESFELHLLAQLQRLGYEVRRAGRS